MKNVIIILAVMFLAGTSTAYSTPILEYDKSPDDQVILYDILALEFTRYDDSMNISEDINLNIAALDIENSTSEFAFSSTWTPSWDHTYNWDWIFDWFNWFDWTILFPPRPIPVDNPSPGPEPATMLLFGTGLVGLALISRKERKK